MNDYIEGMRHLPGCSNPPGHGGDCTVGFNPVRDDTAMPQLEARVFLLSQPELVEGLADLLEDALHSPLCYIDPDETHCMCLIGQVKALLPLCEATTDNGHGIKWRCVRTIHPSTPDMHSFGRV